MNRILKLLAATAAGFALGGGAWVFGQTTPSPSPSPSATPSGPYGVLGPCPAPSPSPSASPSVSPSASPSASAVPAASQCITLQIPPNAASLGSAAYGANPLVIPPNTMVTWLNNDTASHSVTANDGSFDSGPLAPGQSFSYTFVNAGSYPYYSTVDGPSVSGTIEVSTASPSPTVSPVVTPVPSVTTIPTAPTSPTQGTVTTYPTAPTYTYPVYPVYPYYPYYPHHHHHHDHDGDGDNGGNLP